MVHMSSQLPKSCSSQQQQEEGGGGGACHPNTCQQRIWWRGVEPVLVWPAAAPEKVSGGFWHVFGFIFKPPLRALIDGDIIYTSPSSFQSLLQKYLHSFIPVLSLPFCFLFHLFLSYYILVHRSVANTQSRNLCYHYYILYTYCMYNYIIYSIA